jgi:uncharacterized repeat protein (TIGR03803 family)
MHTNSPLFRIGLTALLGVAVPATVPAESFAHGAKLKTIYSFCSEENCTDGDNPNDLLFDSAGKTIYGTTNYGGTYGHGTFFTLSRGKTGKWKHKVLFEFPCDNSCPGGFIPNAGLIRDKDGNFYGTARLGALSAPGGVFKLAKEGKNWVSQGVYDFCQVQGCADGATPEGLTYAGQASGAVYDGVSPLYGVTNSGGAHNDGEVYSLTPDGGGWTFNVLYSFNGDGFPYGPLTVAANGDLFGTMADPYPRGSIFKISFNGSQWSLVLQHRLNGNTEGSIPGRNLYLDSSGNVFGTARDDGDQEFEPSGGGTLFELSGSTFQVIRSFCSVAECKDGMGPNGGVRADTNGNLIGVLQQGGKFRHGAVYRWNGTESKLLYSFCKKEGCPDGDQPYGEVAFDLSGNVYGMTYTNANGPGGSIFELTP